MMDGEPLSAQELRTLFVSILKAAYEKQITNGELEAQHILAVALEQSLEFSAEAVSNGEPLKDWEILLAIQNPIVSLQKRIKSKMKCCLEHTRSKRSALGLKARADSAFVERSLSVMSAHRSAQQYFIQEFQDADSELSEAGKVVIEESQKQFNMAEAVLCQLNPQIVQLAVSHKFCKILLNIGISYMEKLVTHGLLKESEGEHFVEELEGYLDHVLSCDELHHPGELTTRDDDEIKIAGTQVERVLQEIAEEHEGADSQMAAEESAVHEA
jgi:hypothetical protein